MQVLVFLLERILNVKRIPNETRIPNEKRIPNETMEADIRLTGGRHAVLGVFKIF